ncbi:MAG: CopG family transcriptional regulator [Roseobacter sp.]|nr:CopG family transcriptional regulator [Roseobacter sp.]HBM38953.1 CopG family transcriptional regulator [Sulfitobacter sp.]
MNTTNRPTDTGIPQRGAGPVPQDKKPKRIGEKRLTLALDGDTYKRLRMHAAETDLTHQAILEVALTEYLKRADAQLRFYVNKEFICAPEFH